MRIGIVGSRRRNTKEDNINLFGTVVGLVSKKYAKYLTVGYELCESLKSHFNRMKPYYEKTTIITGDCDKGGDKFARDLEKLGFKVIVKRIKDPDTGEEMDFNNHRWFDYFTMCNIFYKRDEEIAKEEMDYLIALVALDRKGGTEKTITYFKKYHKDWEKKLIII